MGSLTWNTSSIPELSGKTFIVTGGNSGIGYECSKGLAEHGARVIVATHGQDPCGPTPTDQVDGPGAVLKIKGAKPGASVEYMECDLSSFRSIRNFAESFKSRGLPLHGLINNAGLQTPPDATTDDGFEITVGINFFGPFYLTQLLLPSLKASTPSRVVWVSSPEETIAETNWSDIRGTKLSTDIHAYANSKLWDLMVALELNERLKGTGVESFACHPGMCRTDLFRKGDHDKMATQITDWAQWIAGQTAANGALPLLYCATAPELTGKGGTYYGAYYKGPWTPNVFNTSQRTPGNAEANDPQLRARLYDEAVQIVNEVAGGIKIHHVGATAGASSAGTGIQGGIQGAVASGVASGKAAMATLADKATDARNVIADKAAVATNVIADKAIDAKNVIADKAAVATNVIADKAIDAKNVIADKATDARNVIADRATDAKNVIADKVAQGGAALGVGAPVEITTRDEIEASGGKAWVATRKKSEDTGNLATFQPPFKNAGDNAATAQLISGAGKMNVGNVEKAGGGMAWEATPKDSTKVSTGTGLGFAGAGGVGATDKLTGGAPVQVADVDRSSGGMAWSAVPTGGAGAATGAGAASGATAGERVQGAVASGKAAMATLADKATEAKNVIADKVAQGVAQMGIGQGTADAPAGAPA